MSFEKINPDLLEIAKKFTQYPSERDQTPEAFIEQSNTLQKMLMTILLKEEITTPELKRLIDEWCIKFLELQRYLFPLGETQSLTFNIQTSSDQTTIQRIVLHTDYVTRLVEAIQFSQQEITEMYLRDIVRALVDVKFFTLGKSICRANYLPEMSQEHQTHIHMFQTQLDEIFDNPISPLMKEFLDSLEF